MKRPFTPLIAIAAGIVAFYGFWSIWKGVQGHNWMAAAYGAFAAMASIGAALRRAWSKWLALAVVALFIGAWAYTIWTASQAGIFPMERPLMTFLALLPGLAMCIVALGCVYAFFAFFSVVESGPDKQTVGNHDGQ